MISFNTGIFERRQDAISKRKNKGNKKLQVKEMTEFESYLQYFEKFLEKPEEAKIQTVLEKLKTNINFGSADDFIAWSAGWRNIIHVSVFDDRGRGRIFTV